MWSEIYPGNTVTKNETEQESQNIDIKLNETLKSNLERSQELSNFKTIPDTCNLVGIRSVISPRLLYALSSAGWRDDMAIVDSSFPVETLVHTDKIIRLDGLPILPLVREIMHLWQLDQDNPLAVIVNKENKVERT